MGTMLKDSSYCRLCATESEVGYTIFDDSEEKASLAILINKYLPINVFDDGQLPVRICERCHMGVAATVDLIDRMVEGQQKLRTLLHPETSSENFQSSLINIQGHTKPIPMDDLAKGADVSKVFSENHPMRDAIDGPKSLNIPVANSGPIPVDVPTVVSDPTPVSGSLAVSGPNSVNGSTFVNGITVVAGPVNESTVVGDPNSINNPTVVPGFTPLSGPSGSLTANQPLPTAVNAVAPKRRRGRPRKGEVTRKPKDTGDTKVKLEFPGDGSALDGPRRARRKASLPLRYKDSIAGKDFEDLLETQIKEEEPDEEFDENDMDYKYTGGFLPLGEASDVDLAQMTCEDGTSIVIAPEPSENQADLPVSVNIEVDFQEDTNTNLGGPDDARKKKLGTPTFQVTKIGQSVTKPFKSSIGESTLFKKRRGAKKKVRWTCDICGKGFLHKGRYVLHTRLHKQVILQCASCRDRFSTLEDLNIHQSTTEHKGLGIIELENEEKKVDFKCPHCPNRTFFTQEGYNTHVSSMHEGAKPFACGTCGKRFAYQHSLRNHFALHEAPKEEREYPCPTCGKIFSHPSSLIYHRESTHNNGRLYVCHVCNSSFKHKQLLQRHYSVHSEERPYPCEVCHQAFKTRGNLYNHMNTHTGLKKFTCEICGKLFNHLTSLTLHVRSHTGEKPYKCEYCSKRFTQNGNLQEHIRIHTGEKPYCCDSCGKKFTTSSQFRLHMRRHAGDRPFKCSYCSKGFLNRDTCRAHERKHSGEKPYICAVCNKGFTEQYTLRKHLRMHTGEKPYSCSICGKTFSDASNLHKHKRSHTDDETWLLPASSSIEETDSGHRIIYILSDKDDPDAATLTALQSVDSDMGETSSLSGRETPVIQGFTLATYDQPSPSSAATAMMLHERASQNSDRQIQIFTDESGRSVIPVINSSGETIGEVQGHIVASSEGSQSSSLTNNSLELALKDGQSLSLVIPEGEDPSLYVHRAIENAVISQQPKG